MNLVNGAIFYGSKYGSTAQYARWIGAATGLPVFDVDDPTADPSEFDFLVIGSPIIYYRLWFRRWVKEHSEAILRRPTILFSVSGTGPGAKLDGWIERSLPAEIVDHVQHVALWGRQVPTELTRFDRMMLIVGGLMNRDREAGKRELQGFDFMDEGSIQPIVELISKLGAEPLQASTVSDVHSTA